MDIPPTPSQVLLSTRVAASDKSSTNRGGISGHSVLSLRRQKARNDLAHLLLVAPLTHSRIIFKSLVSRYTTISRFRAAMRAKFGGILLQDGTTPTPDDVNDFLPLVRYSNIYIRYRGSSVSRTIWKEMGSYH